MTTLLATTCLFTCQLHLLTVPKEALDLQDEERYRLSFSSFLIGLLS